MAAPGLLIGSRAAGNESGVQLFPEQLVKKLKKTFQHTDGEVGVEAHPVGMSLPRRRGIS